MRVSAPLHAATFECVCGQQHRSADGVIPMGWTIRHGSCRCVDCSRADAVRNRKQRKAA